MNPLSLTEGSLLRGTKWAVFKSQSTTARMSAFLLRGRLGDTVMGDVRPWKMSYGQCWQKAGWGALRRLVSTADSAVPHKVRGVHQKPCHRTSWVRSARVAGEARSMGALKNFGCVRVKQAHWQNRAGARLVGGDSLPPFYLDVTLHQAWCYGTGTVRPDRFSVLLACCAQVECFGGSDIL